MAALALVACGEADRTIQSSVAYEPPLEHAVVVETVVELPFDVAWSELIRRLSESPYQVATLEKASRLVVIELDRSSDLARPEDRPSRFIDCGRTLRTFEREGVSESFEYAVVDSSHHRESSPVEGGFRVSDVQRRVGLEARSARSVGRLA